MNEKQEWELTPDSIAKTLTQAPGIPLGLFERLKYTAEIVAKLDAEYPAGAYLIYRDRSEVIHANALGSNTLVLVGRSAEADLSIADDSRLSRRHFQVRGEDGCYFVEDLGATNGTRLNGRELAALEDLRSGDLIEAGLHVFVFIVHDPL